MYNAKSFLDKVSADEPLFKSLPFWSWNDKLEADELEYQIEEMKKAGIGGFFMHARGGLETKYMGDEWFDCVKACINKAKEIDMDAWAYDEDGWPSGFAGGIVPSSGEKYQQKSLCLTTVESTERLPESALGYYSIASDGNIQKLDRPSVGCYAVSLKLNKYYIDALNKDAIAKFLEVTHDVYYERFGDDFGKTLKGFFTDEPQFSNGEIPWSQNMEQLFFDKYGYSITERLILLFINGNGFEKLRFDYYSLVNALYVDVFIKQMFDWCTKHDCMLTGHVMGEDSLLAQMASTAGAMPAYEYFHIPGMDWLGRYIASSLTPKQLGSVCAQLDKKRVITESFALCGWDVSFEELKWIAEWQFVNGVNMICQHLEGYTLRGFRKRDYPPSLFVQQPWFSEYSMFNNYFARLGSALSQGQDAAKLLLLHPIQSAHILYEGKYTEGIDALHNKFIKLSERLSGLQIEYHYGDETILKKHGFVDKSQLRVGSCRYDKVLLPCMLTITKETLALLQKFIDAGGQIYSCDTLPYLVDGEKNRQLDALLCKVIHLDSDKELAENLFDTDGISVNEDGSPCTDIHLRKRVLDDGSSLYFMVNLSQTVQFNPTLTLDGQKSITMLDFASDKQSVPDSSFSENSTQLKLSFEPMQSYVLLVSDEKINPLQKKQSEEIIPLKKDFTIENQTSNALTLDKCRYRIDNGEWHEKRAVILLQHELLQMQKACTVDMLFDFNIDDLSEINKLSFAAECPSEYEISVNGQPFYFTGSEWFVDKSFRMSDIKKYVKTGKNEILMSRKFYQSPNVYHALFGENVHETEKNKLTYNVELESVYIVGDFSLSNSKPFTFGERKSIFTEDCFSITSPQKTLDIESITTCGYWFFSGNMTLSQEIHIQKENDTSYLLHLKALNMPVCNLYVNGKPVKSFAFKPHTADVTQYLENGSNTISFEVFSSNRNLLGPHHHIKGECHYVGHGTFTDTADWSDNTPLPKWIDGYAFVKFGIEI